jgi:hypothetical protein
MSTRTQVPASWLLAVAVAVGGAQRVHGQGREAPRNEVNGLVKSVDGGAGTVTLSFGDRRGEPMPDRTFTLVKDAEVVVGAGGYGRGGLFREAKLAELTAGTRVTLLLTADKTKVETVVVEEPTVRGLLKSVDAGKNTLTLEFPAGREQGAEEKTFALAADAEIALDDGRGKRFSIREGKLTDLTPGALVTVRLSLDRKQAHGVLAEGATLHGTIKALDAGKRSLTLVLQPGRERGAGGEAGEERTLTVAPDAVIVVDDGKGRRLSLKQVKLADVPAGAAATVKLTPDQSAVAQFGVEGPTLTGFLKSVDPNKGLVILNIPKGRGEDPEEKVLTLAKDVRVLIDGVESPLANLKVGDNGTSLQLRLSLDQKTVQIVQAQTIRPR